MKVDSPWERLGKDHFWSVVDSNHNSIISRQLTGCKDILDLGCGYGSLTHHLRKLNFNCVGIDSDPISIENGKLLFPDLEEDHLLLCDAIGLDFHENQFDGIVLRDTLHHLYQESDLDKSFSEIERVIKSNGILVIFDPNPNFLLKILRKLSKHEDAQCSYQEALELLKYRGWNVHKLSFHEIIALGLSGGYVGTEFIPSWNAMHSWILDLNNYLVTQLSRTRLGPQLLLRYCIKAEFIKQ